MTTVAYTTVWNDCKPCSFLRPDLCSVTIKLAPIAPSCTCAVIFAGGMPVLARLFQ